MQRCALAARKLHARFANETGKQFAPYNFFEKLRNRYSGDCEAHSPGILADPFAFDCEAGEGGFVLLLWVVWLLRARDAETSEMCGSVSHCHEVRHTGDRRIVLNHRRSP